MKKLLLVREILNGIARIVKSLNCKIRCCCESSCNQQQKEE